MEFHFYSTLYLSSFIAVSPDNIFVFFITEEKWPFSLAFLVNVLVKKKQNKTKSTVHEETGIYSLFSPLWIKNMAPHLLQEICGTLEFPFIHSFGEDF